MKTIITLLLCSLAFSVSSQEIKFGKVSKEELKEEFYPLDATASAAYLYKCRKTYYIYVENEGFIVVTEVHERIKIYDKEGLKYANKLVSYYKPETGSKEKIVGIKGYTFNLKDGEIEKEKLSGKQVFEEKKSKYVSYKKLAMPAVKVGSVLDLKYEIRSPYHRIIDDVEFQYAIPVKKYATEISIPEYFTFRKNSKGYYHIKPRISSSSKSINFSTKSRSTDLVTKVSFQNTKVDYKTIDNIFTDENIPALKDDEPYAGNVKNYRGGISYELSVIEYPNSVAKHYSTTWKDVSEKIYKSPSFGNELDKTNYFKKDLSILLQKAKNKKEILNAVFQFVKFKVKWNKYYGKYVDNGVKKAYKSGVGNVADINLILTAMLRASGLNANPVLVSSKNNGVPMFPTNKGFNYVISMVEFTDGTYFLLDATELLSSPNVLPERVLNWNGRKIMKNGESSWVTLRPSTQGVQENKIYIKITEGHNIEGIQRSTFKNTEALKYRLKNNKKSEDEVLVKLEEEYDIEIDQFKVLNKDNLSKSVTRNIKLTKEDAVEEINGKLYISPLLYMAIKENPFKSEERKFPVDFVTPWLDKSLISLMIPEGYKVEFLPESLAIGLPDGLGMFKFLIKSEEKKINIQSLLQFDESMIGPQYYEDLKFFFKEVVTKQSEKIILVKK